MKQCTEVLDAVRGCTAQIEHLERQVQETERRVLEKQQSLDHLLDGNDADIQRDLDDFDGIMRQRRQELQTLQRSVTSLNAEIAQVRESTEQLVAKRGQAEMLQRDIAKLKAEQVEAGSKLVPKYSLPLVPAVPAGTGWSPSVTRNFLQNLNNEVCFFVFCMFVLFFLQIG